VEKSRKPNGEGLGRRHSVIREESAMRRKRRIQRNRWIHSIIRKIDGLKGGKRLFEGEAGISFGIGSGI
jgi:hypothetical protein